jgi:hypothetical protein
MSLPGSLWARDIVELVRPFPWAGGDDFPKDAGESDGHHSRKQTFCQMKCQLGPENRAVLISGRHLIERRFELFMLSKLCFLPAK